jgi:CRP/FNR family transcriptional regulator, cyclic AMP receptor protein
LSRRRLAEMVATTRPRMNVFMNKFRTRGFIEYDARSVNVNNSLLGVVLAD